MQWKAALGARLGAKIVAADPVTSCERITLLEKLAFDSK